MEDGRITDSQITASGYWPNSVYHGPTNARLNRVAQTGTVGAWIAESTTDKNQWIQAALGETAQVTGVMTQGRAGSQQYVTKFKVLYSDDGEEWNIIQTANQKAEQVYRPACKAFKNPS